MSEPRRYTLTLPCPPSANRWWRRAGTHMHKSAVSLVAVCGFWIGDRISNLDVPKTQSPLFHQCRYGLVLRVYPDLGQGEWGFCEATCKGCGRVAGILHLEPLGHGKNIDGTDAWKIIREGLVPEVL